jgi:hypothetical protein
MLVDGDSRTIARVHRDVLRYHPRGYHAVEQRIEIEDETGRVHRFHGEVVAATAVPAWPNLGYTVCIYRWTDEQGLVSHCTYQEAWDDAYQRAMGKRFTNVWRREEPPFRAFAILRISAAWSRALPAGLAHA